MTANVGVDTGASRTRICGLADEDISFQTPNSYQEYLEVLVSEIGEVGQINNMVVGLPSVIENDKPMAPPNLGQGWDGCNIKEDIVRHCDNIVGWVKLVQDTEAAAWGFLEKGIVREFPAMAITLSTGVGGAVMWPGTVKPLEIGHMVLDLSGKQSRCACGQIGCAEADLSGGAVYRATGVIPEELGDDFWRGYGIMFAKLLAVVVPLFCLKEVVLFGGLSNQAVHFLPAVKEVLAYTINEGRVPKLIACPQCDSIGAYGARVMANTM